jgi:hypothetical protein
MLNAEMNCRQAGDWCHLCGKRDLPLADIWYAENAENDREPMKAKHYVRICAGCGDRIGRVARSAKPLGDGT